VLLTTFNVANLMPRRKRGPLGGIVPFVKLHRANSTVFSPQSTGSTCSTSVTTDLAVTACDAQFCEGNVGAISLTKTDDDLSMTLSRYRVQKDDALSRWTSMRSSLLHAAWDTCCPAATECVICDATASDCLMIRCKDCGPQYIVCAKCADNDHLFRPLHLMEMWKVTITVILATIYRTDCAVCTN